MARHEREFSRTDPDQVDYRALDGKVTATFQFKDELMEALTEDERKMLELTIAGFSRQVAGIVENKRNFERAGLSVMDGLMITNSKLLEAVHILRGKH